MRRYCSQTYKIQPLLTSHGYYQSALSNKSRLRLPTFGAGMNNAGLKAAISVSSLSLSLAKTTHKDVPQFVAGLPIMILSDTPAILSLFPYAAASNKWSVVFSKLANINTLSFIFATPNRVIPRISPYCPKPVSI